jgi:single-strand DNA-binding protein
MKSINRVTLLGRLGSDPDIKLTANQQQLAVFNLATTNKWKDNAGEWQEKTDWHRVICWERMAEMAGKELKKGTAVFVEGTIATRNWEDDKGQKHYMTEVNAKDLVPLS